MKKEQTKIEGIFVAFKTSENGVRHLVLKGREANAETLLRNEELIPAYGRDYKSKAEAIAAFDAGKDFELASIFHGGRYCSKSDFAEGARVLIRYKRLTQIAAVTVKGGAA